MTSTQTSFSAFAAKQTASVTSLAVPADSGQRGCFFLQPDFHPAIPFLTGRGYALDLRWEDGFYQESAGCLDAPFYVASGGMDTMTIRNQCCAFQLATRG